MSRVMRSEVLRLMKTIGLVPVFYHEDPAVGKQVVEACLDGGARVVEFTNRGPGAWRVFNELIEHFARTRPELILGAGSIVDASTAALYLATGASFIVSPVLDEETGYLCNSHKVAWCPGCATPTEIHRAHRLGADIVKIFPGETVGGPDFVRALLGPCPQAELMPTGGVIPEEGSLREWFDAGVSCVGLGSKLISSELLKTARFDQLRLRVAEVANLIKKIRE